MKKRKGKEDAIDIMIFENVKTIIQIVRVAQYYE